MRSRGRRGRRVVEALNPAPGGGRLGDTEKGGRGCMLRLALSPERDRDPSHAAQALGVTAERRLGHRQRLFPISGHRELPWESFNSWTPRQEPGRQMKLTTAREGKCWVYMTLFQHSDCDQA